MKGTIDQLDAFFSGVTGIWSRLFSFFATCWLGHAVGYFALRISVPYDPSPRFEPVSFPSSLIDWAVWDLESLGGLPALALPLIVVLTWQFGKLLKDSGSVLRCLTFVLLAQLWLTWLPGWLAIIFLGWNDSWHPLFLLVLALTFLGIAVIWQTRGTERDALG